MNDKERLIHIAGKVDKLCAEADSEGNGPVNIFAIQNDMNWLISKIEQHQKEIKELKIAGEFFETGYHQLEKENKRYREVLEKIANHETYGIDIVSHEFRMSDVGELAREALEGESNE